MHIKALVEAMLFFHSAGETLPSLSEPVPPSLEVNVAVLPLQHLLQLTPLAQTVLVAGQAGHI